MNGEDNEAHCVIILGDGWSAHTDIQGFFQMKEGRLAESVARRRAGGFNGLQQGMKLHILHAMVVCLDEILIWWSEIKEESIVVLQFLEKGKKLHANTSC